MKTLSIEQVQKIRNAAREIEMQKIREELNYGMDRLTESQEIAIEQAITMATAFVVDYLHSVKAFKYQTRN